MDRDPSASDLVAAQVSLANGGGLSGLMSLLANSGEAHADMASTYAAEGAAASSQAELNAFADAMSTSYGAPIEVFSVDPTTGAQTVLADTSTTNLLAELPVLQTEANGVNLALQLADGMQIGFDTTGRLAQFLYAMAVKQLQATSFVTDDYNLDERWLNTVDQPLLNEAVSWSEQATQQTALGGAYYTSLADGNNAQASLALKIAAEAPGSRQDMSVTISNPYTGNPTQVTVYAGGGNSVHDYAPSVVDYVESAIGVLVNIAAVAFQQPEFYWAAAAVDAAEAGQDFSNGEDLQGILSVAQALSAGITAGAGGTVGGVAPPVSAQVINVASEAVGGIYGIVQSAKNGNGAGILAGALEAAAAAAAGFGIKAGGDTQKTLNLVSTALGTASVATDVGSDFASGNLGQGLVDSLNLFLPELAQEYADSQSNQSQLQQPQQTASATALNNAAAQYYDNPSGSPVAGTLVAGLAQAIAASATASGSAGDAPPTFGFKLDVPALTQDISIAPANGLPNFANAIAPLASGAMPSGGYSTTATVNGATYQETFAADPSNGGNVDVSVKRANGDGNPTGPVAGDSISASFWGSAASTTLSFLNSVFGFSSAYAAQPITDQQAMGVADYLTDNVTSSTTSYSCAHELNLAFRSEGLISNIVDAKDFGSELTKFGYQPLTDLSTYTPQIGDIAVIKPTAKTDQSGHVDVWTVKGWVSDYVQPDYGNNVTNDVGTYVSPVPGSPNGNWANAEYIIYRH